MRFAFIARHRSIWPVAWLCDALDVSRSGFHAWLTRSPSQRSVDDEVVGAKVRASFKASDRTYGARRVWRDVLAEGVSCGLHRIERLMRAQALRARPRRRGLPKDCGERPISAIAPNVLDRQFTAMRKHAVKAALRREISTSSFSRAIQHQCWQRCWRAWRG